MKDNIWQEKYRPEFIMQVISEHSPKISNYLKNPDSIPNFLFYSRCGGTGKSSMCKAIVNELKCDCLTINASSDRSIDNIRTKVKDFARSKSTNGMKRCIFMDEFEKLSKDSMDALKNMIEEYSRNCFYVCTTNNIDKIPQPIQSRFVVYQFTKPDKTDIKKYLIEICDKESLKYTESAIDKMIDIQYPSIRNCVKTLQDIKVSGKNVSDDAINLFEEDFKEIWEMIKAKDFSKARIKIFSEGIDCLMLNRWMFYNIFNENFDLKKQIALIRVLGKNERDMSGADTAIIMISSIPDIILAVKD